MTNDSTLKPPEGREQTEGYLSEIKESLTEKRSKVWFVAIVSMFLTIISTFGFYDMAPTALFNPPDGNYVNTTLATSNQTFTSEIVQKEIYRNNSANNSNLYVYPDQGNTITVESLLHFSILAIILVPLAVLSNWRCWKTGNKIVPSLFVPVLFFIYILIVGAIGGGVHSKGSLWELALLSYLGIILLLSFLFLIAYSAQGDPNPLAENELNETAVDLYTNKLSRTAQGVLSVGLAITIGGAISYGIGGSASPRVIPIAFLSGIILMPTFGIVTILHLRLHWMEQYYRENKIWKEEG